MTKSVGVLGTGIVGVTLANGLRVLGYNVTLASRNGKIVESWDGPVGAFTDVAEAAELLVLAVKGEVALDLVKGFKRKIAGKTVIDTTNPILVSPPVNGVIQFFTGPNESLMERMQEAAPDTKFVKAFNSVGASLMLNPDFDGIKPTMFICGNSPKAKQEITAILEKFGWEAEDMGAVEAARAIEPLCMLWCIPPLLGRSNSNAFKFLKK